MKLAIVGSRGFYNVNDYNKVQDAIHRFFIDTAIKLQKLVIIMPI